MSVGCDLWFMVNFIFWQKFETTLKMATNDEFINRVLLQ